MYSIPGDLMWRLNRTLGVWESTICTDMQLHTTVAIHTFIHTHRNTGQSPSLYMYTIHTEKAGNTVLFGVGLFSCIFAVNVYLFLWIDTLH